MPKIRTEIFNLLQKHLLKVDKLINSNKYNLSPEDERHIQLYKHDINIFLGFLSDSSLPINQSFIESWSTAIWIRMDFYNTVSDQLKDFFMGFINDKIYKEFLSKYYDTPFNHIYFSQYRCNATFAQHQSVNKELFIYTGKNVLDISETLRKTPSLADEISISIAKIHMGNTSHWVTFNNRGYSTLSLAGIKPVRIIPLFPSTAELKRLKENDSRHSNNFFKYKDATCISSTPIKSIQLEKEQLLLETVLGVTEHIKPSPKYS
ncbi:MAG: hypothetical protein PSV35_02840 [bacterium]|nr:hypothetical protein [bacterium]